MTKNKMDKHVENNMLDGLLDDSDKPQPPKQTYYGDSYGRYGRGSSSWENDRSYNRGTEYNSHSRYGATTGDDDESDLPEMYRTKQRPAYQGSRSRATSVYGNHSTHVAYPQAKSWGSEATALMAIDALTYGQMQNGGKSFFLDAAAHVALTNATIRAIGEFFDQIGICWGEGGVKNAKLLIADLLANNIFYDGPNGYIALDFDGDYSTSVASDDVDPTTGEIVGSVEHEERLAIMGEVDPGATISEDGDNPGEV